MIDERELAERLKSAAGSMPLTELRYDMVLPRAKVASRRLTAILAASMLAVTALAVVALSQLLADSREKTGEVIAPPESNVMDIEDVRPVVEAFAHGMNNNQAEETWELLTPRAQEAIGGLSGWKNKLGSVKYLFSWIDQRNHELLLSPVRFPGRRAVVVVTEPQPRNGSWLLSALTVREVSGRILVDLDLDRQVSLTPEFPLFQARSAPACEPDQGCSPLADSELVEALPTISPGDTFSVLLEPEDSVEDVLFSVGGDAWVAEAELDQQPGIVDQEGPVRATADFEAEGLPEQTVFLVSIIRPDGGVDAYGYRVRVED